MFLGEYHHNIDTKGRLIIPAKFRDALGEVFYVTRGMEKCLFVYSKTDWDLMVNKLKALPFTKKKNRDFQRFFLSGAIECEIDNQGRVNISDPLVKYADLEKACVVVGVNDRLEIWSKDSWNVFIDDNIEDFANIAEDIFDFE